MRAILDNRFEILTLKEAGIDLDIPEPHDTIEANATEKSKVIYTLTGMNCFSEDTGLEVEVLNGEPGVKSARYAGDEKQPHRNIEKLLSNLSGITNRKARFKTVISLMLNGTEHLFEGICEGTITQDIRGSGGFGYDPVFLPDNAHKTFGEMGMEEKTRYSHRARATEKLVTFLNNL